MKKKTTSSNLRDKPSVKENEILIIYSPDEVVALSQILLFAKNILAEMAINLQKQGNTNDAETMNSRSMLSNLLLNKVQQSVNIGEPESRQIH